MFLSLRIVVMRADLLLGAHSRLLTTQDNRFYGARSLKEAYTQVVCRLPELPVLFASENIIDGLGGVAKAEVTLAELSALLQKQSNGEVGPLRANYPAIHRLPSSGKIRTTSSGREHAESVSFCAHAVGETDGSSI